jgi:hypothetical protein
LSSVAQVGAVSNKLEGGVMRARLRDVVAVAKPWFATLAA